MNLSLLREYVKPGCKVYLKCTRYDMGKYYKYYVPCYVHALSISNMCTSIQPDINFELVFVEDPERFVSDVNISVDRIYVIWRDDLIPLEKYIPSIGEAYIVGGRNPEKSTVLKNALNALNALYGYRPGKFEPDFFDSNKIIFSGNCTIVIWKDGTKTIARCSKGDDFSPEAGLAICFMKHVLGESKAKKILRNGNKIFESEVEG